MWVILVVLIEGKGKFLIYFVRYFVKMRIYLLLDFVVGKGLMML